MACDRTVAKRQIVPEDELRADVQNERMVEAIENPREERMHPKENAFLGELIKLRVSVQKTSRDKLIKDT